MALRNAAPALIAELRETRAALAKCAAALNKIAWEPMGDPEASAVTVLGMCVEEAKAVLADPAVAAVEKEPTA